MYIPDDDVLNVLNNNTENNYNDLNSSDDDELDVLNSNTERLDDIIAKSNPNSNRVFDFKLDDNENAAREEGYVQNESGVIRGNYDDTTMFDDTDTSVLTGRNKFSPRGAGEDNESEIIEPEISYSGDSSSIIYNEVLGITQYKDLRKVVGLADDESYTDYYNKTHYIPKGYEVTARLLMAEEKVKKHFADYQAGNIGYADFLYKAYGKDILKSQGIDLNSSLYWYNKAQKNDFTNPLDSDSYLADVLSMASSKFQAESWYEFATKDKLAETTLAIASGGEVSAENLKKIYGEQFQAISDYFQNEEEFIDLYKAGFISTDMFNPFIDIDNDKLYDYYYSTDGKLYAIDGSSGRGNNKCTIYYDDEKDENGYRKVDRVTTDGFLGRGQFADYAQTFIGSFLSVFTGLVDFGAQAIGLIGHAAGNDEFAVKWNAIKNNNLLFGGTHTKDFESFNASEGDDWARNISSAAGTIVGLIASMYITGGLNKLAGTASEAAAAEGAKWYTKAGAGFLKGAAFATRTYTGLRGGNVTSVVPELAEHAIANRMVTATALALRDAVSVANKLTMQNKILPEKQRLSDAQITGRFFITLAANSTISFCLRQIGDSGVVQLCKKNSAFNKEFRAGMKKLEGASAETILDFYHTMGDKSVSVLGSSLLGKGINTVADIVENILTQTNTAFLSNPELSADEYFKDMGSLVLNPAFIATNLYIAKQDMGFHLFGKVEPVKRPDGTYSKFNYKFMPHTEINYAKAAITSIRDLDNTYKVIMDKLNNVYVKLVEDQKFAEADSLMKGIIEPATEMHGGKRGESIVESTLKSLTWLMKQTTDIPVSALDFSDRELARLGIDEKQTGPVRAVILAHMKEGFVEKKLLKATYNLAYYQSAYNQINDANIKIFKGEFDLYDAYVNAKNTFESEALPVNEEKRSGYEIDSDEILNNNRIYEAINNIDNSVIGSLKSGEKILLTKGLYEKVVAYLEQKQQLDDVTRFKRVADFKTENVTGIRNTPNKISLNEQLNLVLGMAGLKNRLDETMFNVLKLQHEMREEDYQKINATNFSEDFEKVFEIKHVENQSNGKYSDDLEKLCANEDIKEYVKKLNYADVKSFLASTNILTVKGTAVNDLREGNIPKVMVGCLDAFVDMKLMHKISYNDGGENKVLYVIPYEGSLIGGLKTTDNVGSAMKCSYLLAVSKDKDDIKSACNALINILLDADLVVSGKNAKEFVKNYSSVEVEDRDGTIHDVHDYNIDFLGNSKYKEGAEKLIATALAQFAADKYNAINRVQLIYIFDALGIDYNQIDTSTNSIDVALIKDYLLTYKATGDIVDFTEKYNGRIDSNVTPADLKSFEESVKKVLADKRIQNMLIDDKIIGQSFFKNLEDLNSFIEGQLGEIREKGSAEYLAEAVSKNPSLEEFLGSEKKAKKFYNSLNKHLNKIYGDYMNDDLLADFLLYHKFQSGSVKYDKKDLVIVNLARLETKDVHRILRDLETEMNNQALIDGSEKEIRRLESKLARANLATLQRLSELQHDNPSGILTFDRSNKDDINQFIQIMMSLGYEEKEINGMLSSGISRNAGISYTNSTSRGLVFNMSKEQYETLMKSSAALTNDYFTTIKGTEPISIRMSMLDRFGVLLTDEQIKNLNYGDIKKYFDLEMLPDGSLNLKGIKDVYTAILKLGKSASKLDKSINRVYSNSYRHLFKTEEMGDLYDCLLLKNIIESVKMFSDNKKSGDTETRLYAFNVSNDELAQIKKGHKDLLYDYQTIDNEDGTTKVIVNGINEKNWNLDFILKNFGYRNYVDLKSLFLIPFGDFEKNITRLSEITYNARTLKVDNLNTSGANLLEFVRGQMIDTFGDLEDFYRTINGYEVNVGKFINDAGIEDNFVSVIQKELYKQNEDLINSLKAYGLSEEAIKVVFNRDLIDDVARSVENNMGEYKHLGVDADGELIINKLDYNKISSETKNKVSADDIKAIVSLLKTPIMNEVNNARDIVFVTKVNPYTDIAAMIRYDSKTGKAFISLDDISMMTKEQFEKLESLGLVTKELKDKLSILGKFENGKFKTLTDGDIPNVATRVTYDIGKETTQIMSNGTGYIVNTNDETETESRKLALSFINRSQNRKLEKNQRTLFTKLSSMNLNDESGKWLARMLNLNTISYVDNPGSVMVANAENRLAVGEVIESIGSLSTVLMNHKFDNGIELNLPEDVAVELALKFYFNTTGTDMSSAYNRYTLVYKDDNNEWHIENVGESFENSFYESASLGRGLHRAGVFEDGFKAKEVYLFNAGKNVMSSNASAYGENIRVMNLDEKNIQSLKTTIYKNAIAKYQENHTLDLDKVSDQNLANIIASELGAFYTRNEIRHAYMEKAKTDIMDFVSTQIDGLKDSSKQTYLNVISSQVDSALRSTLETVESLQSSSFAYDLKEQASRSIALQRSYGDLSDKKVRELEQKTNRMIADVIDTFTYMINSDSIPEDVKANIETMREDSKNELLSIKNGEKLLSLSKKLFKDGDDIVGIDIKHALDELNPDERIKAVACMMKYNLINTSRGKNIQFALLGSEEYLSKLYDSYLKEPIRPGQIKIGDNEPVDAKELIGNGKIAIAFDLENFFDDNEDSKIYSISFAAFNGNDNFSESTPKKYRIVIRYDDMEYDDENYTIKGYKTLASSATASSDVKAAYSNYLKLLNEGKEKDGVYVVRLNSKSDPSDVSKIIDKIISKITLGKEFTLVGHNSKETDLPKIQKQFGKTILDNVKNHIDTYIDMGKSGFLTDGKHNESKLSLEYLASEMGEKYNSHDDMDDAIMAYKYLLWKVKNQIDTDKLKSGLIDDVDFALNKIVLSDIDKKTLFNEMTKINGADLRKYFSGKSQTYRNAYKKYGANANSLLIKSLIDVRNMVFNSDEASYIRKQALQDEHEFVFENQSAMLSWLSKNNELGASNRDGFRNKMSMFIELDKDGQITDKAWNDGNELLNKVFLSYKKVYRNNDKDFRFENFMQLPTKEVHDALLKFGGSEIPKNQATKESVARYANEYVNRPDFEDNKNKLLKLKEQSDVNRVFDVITNKVGFKDLNNDVKKLFYNISSAMMSGDFRNAYNEDNSFKIKWNGPVLRKHYYLNALSDAVDQMTTSLKLARQWKMTSGINVGDDLKLENGETIPMSSTTIGLTRKYFESLVGGSVESYREMVGATNPDDDIYIQLYRNPGIGNNVIHTYRVKIIDGNYNSIIMAPEIFSAYHGGDFDSDKIMLLVPDKTTQAFGKNYLEATDKTWSAADELITYLNKNVHTATQDQELKDFETFYRDQYKDEYFSLQNMLDEMREDGVTKYKDAWENAVKNGFISLVDPKEYSTLKPGEFKKNNKELALLAYSEYLPKDKTGHDIIRRLAFDTKFFIKQIISAKDSVTGYTSKTYKPILDSYLKEPKEPKDASDLFTYDQFALSKNSKNRLEAAMKNDKVANEIVDLVNSSLKKNFGNEIGEDITNNYLMNFIANTADASAKADRIIGAYKLAEFLYRNVSDFKNKFNNEIIPNLIDNVDMNDQIEKVGYLAEYAKMVGVNLPKPIEPGDVKNLSYNDLLQFKYDTVKALEGSFDQQRYFGTPSNIKLSTKLLNSIRAQETHFDPDSLIDYIDGDSSDNYVNSEILLVGNAGSLAQSIADDTVIQLNNRHSIERVTPHEVNFSNLTNEDIEKIKTVFLTGKHPRVELSDGTEFKYREQIVSIKTKDGKNYSTIFDKDGDLIVDLNDIKFINVVERKRAIGNKFGMLGTGGFKGTIAEQRMIDMLDIGKDIQFVNEFYKSYETIIDKLINSIESSKKAIKENTPDFTNLNKLKALREKVRTIASEIADLQKQRNEEKLQFNVKQKEKNDLDWDALADSYLDADEKERSRIRELHASVNSKYMPQIEAKYSEIDDIKEEILGIGKYGELLKKELETLEKRRDAYSRKRSAYNAYNNFTKEVKNAKANIEDKERFILWERLFNLGVDPEIYGIENLDIQEVRRLNNEFKKFDYISSSNMFDLKKQGSDAPDFEVTYYDKMMNKLTGKNAANEAAYTKISGRIFFPESNSFYDSSTKIKEMDPISYVNDRTNPDTLIKLHGMWYSKEQNKDGTYTYTYDSKNENAIARILQRKDTPFANPTNGIRIYNTLLAKLLYENCDAFRKEQPNINAVLANMLDGRLSSSEHGRKMIGYIFNMMSDDEIKKLYTSNDEYTKLILSLIEDVMPELNAVDAKEFAETKKIISKTKAKEIAKNKTALYYYTKPQGDILSDQALLNGNPRDENGYPYVDSSSGYIALPTLLEQIASLDKGVNTNSVFHNLRNLTLKGILNFGNALPGTQDNSFKYQSLMDSNRFMRKDAAVAGPSDTKAGDAAASIRKLTPDQKVIGQYAKVGQSYQDLMDANNGNNLLDDTNRNDFIRGEFASNYMNSPSIDLSKEYYPGRRSIESAVYAAEFKNRISQATALSVIPDKIITDIAPRYLAADAKYGLMYTSNPKSYYGSISDYYKQSLEELSGPAQYDIRQPLIQSIEKELNNYRGLKDSLSIGMDKIDDEKKIILDIREKLKSSFDKVNEDIQYSNILKDDDLNYLKGGMIDSKSNNYGDKYKKAIESLKANKEIAVFHTDRLASSNIKEAGMDRTVVAYKANTEGFRNQLLGDEFIAVVGVINSSDQYKNGYNTFIKLKNLLSTLRYCEEKLSSKDLSNNTKEYYLKIKEATFDELGISTDADVQNVNEVYKRYSNIYSELDSVLDKVCDRIYASMKEYCNETGQTCPSRERFFLPIKVSNDSYDDSRSASLLFAGTQKYSVNPFAIRKENTGLNPSGAYKEFDAMTNIVSVATEVAKLQALLTYRDEAKNNGAMSNAMSFDETCKAIGNCLSIESLNEIGDSNFESLEMKGYFIFRNQVTEQLNIKIIDDPLADSSCAKYANMYNQIYHRLIEPTKNQYGDITFNHILSVAMSNPQDAVADKILKAYSMMMDIVGKITTIQIERGEKTTLTDEIYNSITKFAEEHGYAIVDQFGREYSKDLSQFKALSPFATDDYLFRLTHGGLAIEGTYEQNVALDALRGDLYFMDAIVAKHTQSMFYTREPSDLGKFMNGIKNIATKLIMANPAKFASRLLNFSMFDACCSLVSGNPEFTLKLPETIRDISGYMQSNGQYCSNSLREFMNITGVDPFKNQTFYGESAGKSKNPWINFTGKQFTAQHLTVRYALWLSLKEHMEKNGIESIYSKLGNSYYLRNQIEDIKNNMNYDEKNPLGASPISRIAAMIVSNQYGTYGDMPGIAGSMSKHGFMFTTFPLAIARFVRNEIRSGATVIKEVFTGTADTHTLKYLGRQTGSLLGLAVITLVMKLLPIWLSGEDEGEQKEQIEDVLEHDTSLEMFQSILLNDNVYNSSTVWNPFYGAKALVADPLIDAIKDGKANDEQAMEIIGKALATYFNQNVWNRLNPAITTIPNAAMPTNDWTNPYGNQGTNFFDNLARRSLAYSLGTNGSNAFMNTLESYNYDDDSNFVTNLGHGFENALREELGNSKSYKSSWKNYNNSLSIVYDYAKQKDHTSYDPRSASFDKDYQSGLKARLKNAMRVKSSPTVIYGIINEALETHASKEEIRDAIRSVSVRVQIAKLTNQEDFFNSLSQKDFNTVKSALAYEDTVFPDLDDLYDEAVEQIAYRNSEVKASNPTFTYTNSLKTYGYNYPTYYSSNYKRSNKKNYRYNNLSNWNTNRYNSKKSYVDNSPIGTYNRMIELQNNGLSTDVWGNQTRHYTDGTEYTVRQQGASIFQNNNTQTKKGNKR